MGHLDVGVAQREMQGEAVCGDAVYVGRSDTGLLLAVVDGLGHGLGAHLAARQACDTVRDNAALDLEPLMQRVSARLSGSRGAAVLLLQVDSAARRLRCVGVGNVELVARSAQPIRPFSTPGIVGRQVRRLRLFDFELAPGDRLVAFTDGLSQRFELESVQHLAAQGAADALLASHGKSTDDATCVVVDCAWSDPCQDS